MISSPFGPSGDPHIRPDQFLDLDWELFGELCRALAMRIRREFDPELIVGIAKAGVIPAAVVASMLRVDFYAMKISRREGSELVRERPAILSAAPPQARDRRVVLVDEITSSGETFRLGLAGLRDVGPASLRTASVFVRPKGYRPDFHALETDSTIIFPWDRKIFQGDEWIVNPLYEGQLND